MQAHEVRSAHHRQQRKRVGRGNGSGSGTYSGKGNKGQKSRSGGGVRVGFEGGQNPQIKGLPMLRGFKNRFRVEYQVVNVRDLDRCDGDVGPEGLKAAGLVTSLRRPVKILGQGTLEKSLAVSAHKFSKSAQEKIEAAGGSVTVIGAAAADDS